MTRSERMATIALKLGDTSFYKMPASTRFHHAQAGGLLEHSTNVWFNLEKLTSQMGLEWEDPSSPFVIAMLHDACKIDAYFYNHDYGCWERKEDHTAGHGDLSLKVAEELGIELTDEEKACIRWHMGAFDEKENWSEYTNAIHKYPNVLWVHTADMMSAHLEDRPEDKVCCICGKPLGEFGNNPWPVKSTGECCDHCNLTRVIPARLSNTEREE